MAPSGIFIYNETGSFNDMKNFSRSNILTQIKFITCLVLSLVACSSISKLALAADSILIQNNSTHTRIELFSPKGLWLIQKDSQDNSYVNIKTLDKDLYEKTKKELTEKMIVTKYLSGVEFKDLDELNSYSIRFKIVDPTIDLFTFYRDAENKYVVDLWKEDDNTNKDKKISEFDKNSNTVISNVQKVDSVNKSDNQAVEKKVIAKKAIDTKKEENIPAKNIVTTQKESSIEKQSVPVIDTINAKTKEESEVRDFRYGAAFIWDYPAIIPTVNKILDLKSKTPEYFYPIQNREYEKDDMEAHMQLSINFYRKNNYGLMYKSIKLFEQKYGESTYVDLNEYLKINSILKNNFKKKDNIALKMAINMMENIVSRTLDYDLKKAITKYLIEYYNENHDAVKSLQYSKILYSSAMENHDVEEAIPAAEFMVHSFAELKQVGMIEELLNDKTFQKIVPVGTQLAYKFYVLLSVNDSKKVIQEYEKIKKSIAGSVHPTLLFNVGESYFREAKFKEAIDLFDKFVADYGHYSESDYARNRIALSYDLLGEDYKKVLDLYKTAIDRASVFEASYEAKIRYVGLRSARKISIDTGDKEVRIYLDIDESFDKRVTRDLRKILWLVRLRTFIADKDWNNALAYLSAIPIKTLKQLETRVFESDGAEIIYGLISQSFAEADFSKVIKVWELFKNKYMDKVALDPFVNYMVCKSMLKNGLYESFEKLFASFSKMSEGPSKTYPTWQSKQEMLNNDLLLAQLVIERNLKLSNWDEAYSKATKFQQDFPDYYKTNFYLGVVLHKRKDYKNAVVDFEKYITTRSKDEVFDLNEVAELMDSYTDSLYNLNEVEKLKNVATAFLKDIKDRGKDNLYFQKVKERMSYLNIEITFATATKEAYLESEKLINDFIQDFKTSIYSGRVTFLLGRALVKNEKVKEGGKVFEKLIKDDNVSGYIKELARSELTFIKITDKTI